MISSVASAVPTNARPPASTETPILLELNDFITAPLNYKPSIVRTREDKHFSKKKQAACCDKPETNSGGEASCRAGSPGTHGSKAWQESPPSWFFGSIALFSRSP